MAESFELPIEVEECDLMESIKTGFRTGWLSTDDLPDGGHAEMNAGAGVGSPWLTVSIEPKEGEKTHYRIDMRKVFTALIERAVEMETSDGTDEEN